MFKPIKCRANFKGICEGTLEKTDYDDRPIIANPTFDVKDRTYVCNSCLKEIENGHR